MQTTYNTWNSVSGNPTAAAQLGFVAAGVAITNGGVAGKLDTGDTIVVTYNQAVNTATGPASTDNVCTDTGTNTIVLGSTGAGATCATSPATLGTITGMTVSKKSRYAATWTWNGAHTTLTITIGANTAGSAATITGSRHLQPDHDRHRHALHHRRVPQLRHQHRRRKLPPHAHRRILNDNPRGAPDGYLVAERWLPSGHPRLSPAPIHSDLPGADTPWLLPCRANPRRSIPLRLEWVSNQIA